MKPDETILQELQAVAPSIPGGLSGKLLELPEAYFEQFPMQMLARVAAPLSNDVPVGYFESFPQLMLQKMRAQEVADETAVIAPLLNSISKTMPYQVPANYFAQLEPLALGQNQAPQVVPIRRKLWLRVAAAAAILLAAFTIWQMSSSTTQQEPAIAAAQDTIAIPADIQLQLAMMEDDSVEDAYRATGQSVDVNNNLYYLKANDFEEALKDFSTAEISNYLDETPQLKKNI